MRTRFTAVCSMLVLALQFTVRCQTSFVGNNTKQVIDEKALNNWTLLGPVDPVVSNDGRFVSYMVQSKSFQENTLVIKAIQGSSEWKFANGTDGCFSKDNEQFTFSINDTLFFLQLSKGFASKVINVSSYKRPAKETGEWLAYTEKGKEDLFVKNLQSGTEFHYDSVSDYLFSANGKVLLLTRRQSDSSGASLSMTWINLANGKSKKIFERQYSNANQADGITGVSINEAGDALTFLDYGQSGFEASNGIWYYCDKMDSAICKITNVNKEIDSNFTIANNAPVLSKNGKYIFFYLQKSNIEKPKEDAVSVDVWSYLDKTIQSTQLINMGKQKYLWVIDVNGNKSFRLQQEDEQIRTFPFETTGDFIVVCNDIGDRFWNSEFSNKSKVVNTLVSLKDGSRRQLKTNGKNDFYFSPSGNFLIYYDSKVDDEYYSYDLRINKISCISTGIPANSLGCLDYFIVDQQKKTRKSAAGMACWLADDKGMLVYDNYQDIWLLDVSGKNLPVCVTNGYAKRSGIRFSVLYPDSILSTRDTMILMAFNTKNKYNGFYKKSPNFSGNPIKLQMGPWVTCLKGSRFFMPLNGQSFDEGMIPLKAQMANVWILKRESSTEAPNYYWTDDFKMLNPLTNYQPQKTYNWLKTELVSWKQLDGSVTQGVLYKPDNFDPNKKYPLLIYYYEQFSHRLNQFPIPMYSEGPINIPWFVSRGYLILTPDIYFKVGKRGESTCNTVVSAAKYLSTLPYIDGKSIGIAGHSIGGWETNYLVTHSNIFAAALSGAGVANLIQSALSLDAFGSRLGPAESRMGATMWEKPELYIENSPVLKADKVTTPLLIFHCKPDEAVPWEQSLGLFIALRRLEKPVWMLQYDNGNHGLLLKKDERDFTIRSTQFFDHYLKGEAAPLWMTRGIPANKKGIETGLDLEDKKKISK